MPELDRFGRWLSLMALRAMSASLVDVGAAALLSLYASLIARVEHTTTPVLASHALVGAVTGLLAQCYYRRVKMPTASAASWRPSPAGTDNAGKTDNRPVSRWVVSARSLPGHSLTRL